MLRIWIQNAYETHKSFLSKKRNQGHHLNKRLEHMTKREIHMDEKKCVWREENGKSTGES